MSAMKTSQKTFVYTDRISERVLAVKTSRSADFTLDSIDYVTHQILSPSVFPRDSAMKFTYNPVAGLREAGTLSPAEGERLSLLRRKIDTLLLLKFNLAIVKRDIVATFAGKKIREFPVKPENFLIYWKFMRRE